LAQAAGHPLEGTVLKKLADGMQPGRFLRLEQGPNDPAFPEGFKTYSEIQQRGTFHSSADAWAPVAEWCPRTRRVYQVLDRTGNTVKYDRTAISGYDAATHTWIRHKLHPESAERKILGGAHVYRGWAVASSQGKLYRPVKNLMWEYDLVKETWESREFPGFSAPGQAAKVYHPELRRLLCLNVKGEALAWDPVANTLEILPGSNPAHSGRHASAVYNAVRREVMFYAGDNGREITLIGTNRQVTAKTRMPDTLKQDVGSSSVFLAYDPISGNYLSFENRKLFEFHPDLDEWRLALDLSKGEDSFPGYHGHLMTPIPEAGVIMWNHRQSPRLYKHRSVFKTDRPITVSLGEACRIISAI
jgi:hypothetical protein